MRNVKFDRTSFALMTLKRPADLETLGRFDYDRGLGRQLGEQWVIESCAAGRSLFQLPLEATIRRGRWSGIEVGFLEALDDLIRRSAEDQRVPKQSRLELT